MTTMFRRVYPSAQPARGTTDWFLFHGSQVLVREEAGQFLPLEGGLEVLEAFEHDEPVFLGSLGDVPAVACVVRAATLPDSIRAVGVRELFGRFDDTLYAVAGYASHLLAWQRTSRFCPVCGNATAPVEGDWGKRCTVCGFTRYPQISPAILALIHDGDRVLLTHKPGWAARYSIVAGFVEPGESLEECVRREVGEEVGVELGALSYMGSQPWPFPDQLMVGFSGEFAAGEIVIDQNELDDARWFHVDDLPELPAPLSLSRRIIDAWVASRRGAAQ